MKGAYPEVQVHANSGEVITVHPRPHRHELTENEELTGEYRVPKKGEYYWYPFDMHASSTVLAHSKGASGKVTKCGGQARNRFHIIRKVLPRVAVLADGGWAEMTIEEMKVMLKGL